MEAARNRGGLQVNSFIRLRRLFKDEPPVVRIVELGDCESLLSNKVHLRETARQLGRQGITPQDDGWSGWLGRYQKALREAAIGHQRNRARDFGR